MGGDADGDFEFRGVEGVALAKARGARVMLNLSPVLRIEEAALGQVDVLVLKEHEATQLCTTRSGPDHRFGNGGSFTFGCNALAMRFGELTSIGHNIADSLASGVGLLVGVYGMDVFGEARRSPEHCITVDFLSGKVIRGRASPSLARAIALYGKTLPTLCAKHHASPTMFRELTACYSVDDVHGPRFVVTVEDQRGASGSRRVPGRPGETDQNL